MKKTSITISDEFFLYEVDKLSDADNSVADGSYLRVNNIEEDGVYRLLSGQWIKQDLSNIPQFKPL